MENLIGMAAVIAAIFLHKERAIPLIILAFYVMVISLTVSMTGSLGSIYQEVSMPDEKAVTWYVINTAICILIAMSIMCCVRLRVVAGWRATLAYTYACITFITAMYDASGLISASFNLSGYSHVYSLHQQFAIQLDVVVAWLASNNAVSRRINRAFRYDAEQ